MSGPAATITSSALASTTITDMVEGTYSFRLTVRDNSGATAMANVQVIVLPRANQLPTADAGNNQTITLPINSVTLSGSGADIDGTIVSYSWSLTSGPSATITSASSASTTVTAMVAGIYTFTLTVTDNNGSTGTASVQVTVLPRVNQGPTANAGNNQTITLPVNTVTLSGSGTDADGTIASYSWTKISGPAATITSSSSASTTVTNMVEGVYNYVLTVTGNNAATASDTISVTVNAAAKISSASTGVTSMLEGTYRFELKVTDNSGATATANVQVTVLPRVNQAPIANAGNNQTITLPVNTVTLRGGGTDTDGTIAFYSWRKVSGPAATISSPTSASTAVRNMVEGIYTFNLTVTDNEGATGSSLVQVTVLTNQNQPPVANGGADKIVLLPKDTVTITGFGTDVDGTIVSYEWLKINGPAGGVVASPNSRTTLITNLLDGVYYYQFIVTDNGGLTSRDTIAIFVYPELENRAPVANAGPDITVYLPEDMAVLIGSGTDDGEIASYKWKLVSGPSIPEMTDPESPRCKVTSLKQGIYLMEFTVTDNGGKSGSDTMAIYVGNSRLGVEAPQNEKIYPNPVDNILSVQIISDSAERNVRLMLYNSRGTKVKESRVNLTASTNTSTMNVTGMAPGFYILKVVYTTKPMVSLKVIKN